MQASAVCHCRLGTCSLVHACAVCTCMSVPASSVCNCRLGTCASVPASVGFHCTSGACSSVHASVASATVGWVHAARCTQLVSAAVSWVHAAGCARVLPAAVRRAVWSYTRASMSAAVDWARAATRAQPACGLGDVPRRACARTCVLLSVCNAGRLSALLRVEVFVLGPKCSGCASCWHTCARLGSAEVS